VAQLPQYHPSPPHQQHLFRASLCYIRRHISSSHILGLTVIILQKLRKARIRASRCKRRHVYRIAAKHHQPWFERRADCSRNIASRTTPGTMFLSSRIDKRILIGLFVASGLFFFIRWTRTTVPEKAQDLSILSQLARNSGRSYFPPFKQRCPSETAGTTDILLPSSSICTGLAASSSAHVQIVLKTGASERDKTKTALSTLLACSPAVIVLSDMEDEVEGHHVIDILADLPQSYAIDNLDWTAYESQKATVSESKQVYKRPGGWKLDRFKFLPMIEKAFEMNPDADWYFFVEVDTYFFWDTLYRLIDRLDASERHYVGSAAPGSNHTFFGYGGAGLLMSRGLMRGLLHQRMERLSVKYEQWVRDDCCGDAILAYVVREELGVRIHNAYPTFSGEALDALGVSEGNWCAPLLTLHRVTPELMERLWRWERCRPYDEVSTLYVLFAYLLTCDVETDLPFQDPGLRSFAHPQERLNQNRLGQLLQPARSFMDPNSLISVNLCSTLCY